MSLHTRSGGNGEQWGVNPRVGVDEVRTVVGGNSTYEA